MSSEEALLARIVREGPSTLEAVLKYGITKEDFKQGATSALWNFLLSYYEGAKTQGSVVTASMMKSWLPTLDLHDRHAGLTLDALCHEVRRERMVCETNTSIVKLSETIAVPIVDVSDAINTHMAEMEAIQRRGSSSATNRRSAVDLAAPLPPPRWVVQDLGLQPGAPGLIVGYGSSNKSFAAQGGALSLASVDDRLIWGKFKRARRCRVLHLDWEQGEHETTRRYQQLARGMGIDLASLQGYLEARFFPPERLTPENRAYFKRCATDFDVVLIDSFAAARGPGVEENSAEARAPLDMLASISEETGCMFLVVHHAPKGKKDDSRQIARGSSALFDAAGSMLAFIREGDESDVRVMQAKNRGGPVRQPFVLRVVDVPGGGTTIAAGDIGSSDQTDVLKLAETVVAHLDRHGRSWTGSAATLKRHLGVSNRKHHLVQQALNHLLATGRLTATSVGGQQHQTTYALQPGVAGPRAVPQTGAPLGGAVAGPIEAVPQAGDNLSRAVPAAQEVVPEHCSTNLL